MVICGDDSLRIIINLTRHWKGSVQGQELLRIDNMNIQTYLLVCDIWFRDRGAIHQWKEKP